MGPEERDLQPVQLFMENEDGVMVPIGEVTPVSITQASIAREAEPVPVFEEVFEQTMEEMSTPAPAAIQVEEAQQVSELELLMKSFQDIQEGNLYSSQVNEAIEIISSAQTMQQALELLAQHRDLDFKHLLFRQIEEEQRDLNRFMNELQRVPSLPSLDVDFI